LAHTDPAAMVTKICEFQHEIGHSSPYVRDIAQILALSRGFSGSTYLKVTAKRCSDRPPVAMVTKMCEFQHKIGYNSACIRHTTQIPSPVRGYSESAHLRVSDNFVQTDPVAMVTQICEF